MFPTTGSAKRSLRIRQASGDAESAAVVSEAQRTRYDYYSHGLSAYYSLFLNWTDPRLAECCAYATRVPDLDTYDPCPVQAATAKKKKKRIVWTRSDDFCTQPSFEQMHALLRSVGWLEKLQQATSWSDLDLDIPLCSHCLNPPLQMAAESSDTPFIASPGGAALLVFFILLCITLIILLGFLARKRKKRSKGWAAATAMAVDGASSSASRRSRNFSRAEGPSGSRRQSRGLTRSESRAHLPLDSSSGGAGGGTSRFTLKKPPMVPPPSARQSSFATDIGADSYSNENYDRVSDRHFGAGQTGTLNTMNTGMPFGGMPPPVAPRSSAMSSASTYKSLPVPPPVRQSVMTNRPAGSQYQLNTRASEQLRRKGGSRRSYRASKHVPMNYNQALDDL